VAEMNNAMEVATTNDNEKQQEVPAWL